MASEGQNRNKMKIKRDIFSHLGAGRAVEEGNQILKREAPTSL